jgi:hypothetical protein
MSSGPYRNGVAPDYQDAEKGTLEPLSTKSIPSPNNSRGEKEPKEFLNVFPAPGVNVPTLKKESLPTGPTKPAPKAKLKVSKWILFKLWFNTYRCAVFHLTSGPAHAATVGHPAHQKILHFCLRHKYDRTGTCCVRPLAIRHQIQRCHRCREFQLRDIDAK